MHDFTPFSGLAGGALIGLAAALLMLLTGRIAGVTGIVGGLAVGALLGSTMTARSAPAYVYERDYYSPAPVVHYHRHVYEYGDEYPGGYDRGYSYGYREGYSDGYWDND